MIGYLAGHIIDKTEKELILLVSGVGYQITVTSETLAQSPVNQKLELFIHTAVKEDDISLYGFKTKEELSFYRQLLGVSGIGPRMGMEIVSSPIHLVKNAIVSEDISTLTTIKGLGKKTAERLCLELKNKVDVDLNHQAEDTALKEVHEEAIMALESLGYERYHIVKSLQKLPEELKDTEAIVKHFLKSGS